MGFCSPCFKCWCANTKQVVSASAEFQRVLLPPSGHIEKLKLVFSINNVNIRLQNTGERTLQSLRICLKNLLNFPSPKPFIFYLLYQ